ncbi:MAG TPA: response regulator, partial [Nitrospirae bacterium]|nr:response regulator [Nitrospirota bacterium]
MSQAHYPHLKVLSADDSNVIRKILKKALASFDISDVDEARDGREALDKIRENHYDVILLDWTMPRMTGLEVLKEIRKDPDKKDIPVIMITA